MNDPFTPGGFGFGFGPEQRRALHEQRRQARREFREHLREHGTDRHGPFGPGFQAGFGPGRGGFGFDPRGGFGFGGPRGRRGGGRRGKRGDVRAAILVLLADRAMHGYEMIQEISERSGGLWRPSPGSVYPTLQLLVDEGLIVGTESEGSKRLFELTDDGRASAEKIETPPWQEIAEGVHPSQVSLHTAVTQLMGAVAQSAFAASDEQQERIVDIVNNARREIYNILGETDES
ncbi:PadR family transcriptional regulator [Mycolicibacterium sp. 120270]|uniref:PadR family transcriptional regulator n=1 Tax=Mycolicibacterium sp. 120270 TaxID=3090600 RepID=UPI00299EC98A|nr:PadR family transcriptional regulator [Mycolicibacterium sp. 120270]MDX1885900.1 PadR family transcriptional regulator [Mycolicibacterium sp. 120270]